MDRFLQAWLEARAPRNATTVPSRAETEALEDELLSLASLTDRELDSKLADVDADIDDLREEAEWARLRLTEASRVQDRLKLIAVRRARNGEPDAAGAASAPDHGHEHDEDDLHRRHDRAGTAREAVRALLHEDPKHAWTPQLAYDELRRRGRPFTRTAIQTALQRMSHDGLVLRVRAGTYQAHADPAGVHAPGDKETPWETTPVQAPNGHLHERWLTTDVLEELAEEAQVRFTQKHPGVADSEFLVAEAKRRVAVWTEGHGRDPDDPAHVRRLMKTGLHDHYRRSESGSRQPSLRLVKEEDT